MKLLQKRHFTILETLIAMMLLCVILTMIFGFFRELTTITRMTEDKQREAFKTRYVESRLAYAFERVVNENDPLRTFFFYIEQPTGSYTSYPSLVFTFNNEARIDPYFSGDVLARLYVDKEKQLCIAIWPLHAESPYEHMKKEVLLTNVEDIRFELYAAPSKESKDLQVAPPQINAQKTDPERNIWHQNEWFKTYKQMPSIIKIGMEINVKETNPKEPIETRNFSFVLPSSKNPIYFPSSGGSK